MGPGWRFFVAFAALALAPLPQAGAEETPKRGGILTYMIPADSPPSFDGHREETYATIHAAAPFYSVLIHIDPKDPSVNGPLVCNLCTEMPTPADSAPKVPDRMALGEGNEKLVPREEAPVDVNARSGPRVVFPPLNQNSNPPMPASVSPSTPPPPTNAGNGTLANNEPRKIKTLSVKGENADAGAPANAPAPPRATAARAPAAAPRSPPTSANASANAPLSLSPQGGGAAPAAAPEPPARVAAVNPTSSAPAPSGGGYVVQVSSQKTEADAQASYRALQSKFGGVLGNRPPVVKKVDIPEKGVFYRAFAGPFGSQEEASQMCNSLKSAGGQCFVQRN